MRTCLAQCKREKNHYCSFFPPSPFHFLQTVSQFSCSYKQSHATSVQNRECWLFVPQTGISGLCSYPIYISPLHSPLTVWKQRYGSARKPYELSWCLVAMAEMSFRHSRVPAAAVTISHGQGTAFAALEEPQKRQECTSVSRKWQEDSWEPRVWGGGCFCCIPKVVESDHWRWKALHSTGAETTQTTSPYKMLFCHFELSGTITDEHWLLLSQESFYSQGLGEHFALHPLAIRVIIDCTNIHNNLWFLFPLGASIFALKNEVIWFPCDPASAINTDRRIKLIIAFYNALLWLRLFVPLSN